VPETVIVALITSGLTLITGVIVGALLEPLKLRFAAKARIRQLRVDRCTQLVTDAARIRNAASDHGHLVRITGLAHTRPKGEHVTNFVKAGHESFNALRMAVDLVALSGPDGLAEATEAIHAAARPLTWPDDPHADDAVHAKAVERLDTAIAEFTRRARSIVG
jgi:hypothetical protein